MTNKKRNREPPANGESQKGFPKRKRQKPHNGYIERKK